MKKLLLVIVVIMLTAAASQAQDHTASPPSKPLWFSVGVDAGIPFGKASDVYSFIIGGSLQGEYKVAPDLGFTLSAGYKAFLVKKSLSTEVGSTVGIIPVLAGIKYHFTPMIYASGQLGVSFSTQSGGGSSFTYAPGIGFQLSKNIDVLAKYTGISSKEGGTLSEAGVRLAYSF